MYTLVALVVLALFSAPSSARNSQHLFRHRVREADYHGLCDREFISVDEHYAAKPKKIWLDYQEVEDQLSHLAAQDVPFVELTVDDDGEQTLEGNSNYLKFTLQPNSGFPCVQHGCCQHSVLARPHDSDLEVISRAPQEYAAELSKLVGWKPATILDGGGNIGMASVVFAFLYPEANIITLEPVKENCLLAKYNTDTFASVHVQCKGLWSSETSVTLQQGGNMQSWGWQVVETPADTPGASKTTTILSLIEQYHLTGFDYVKLDIEGAEYAVLGKDANTSWIRNTKLLSIEIHGNREPIDAVMDKYGMLAVPFGEYVFYAIPELHALLVEQ